MHILLLTQYFPPETGACQNRLASLVKASQREGVKITVLTAMPHYQAGRVHDAYRGRWFMRDQFAGVEVLRSWVTTSRNSGKWARLFSYLSFVVSSTLVGWRYVPPVDTIIWESPSLILGITALFLSGIKQARLVTNVADLWPESLVALGILGDGPATRLLYRLEEHMYRRSDVISGQTNGIVDSIRRRVPPDKPVVLWRNGAQAVTIDPADRARRRGEWGVPDNSFVVGYAGLMSATHGLTTVLDTAAHLRDREITFVMVGEGPSRSALQRSARDMGLDNVIWVPRQPHDAMPGIWSAFDCAIDSLQSIPLSRGIIPSKLFEAMAAGIPVLLAMEGEAAEIIDSANAGISIAPENTDQMVAAIEKLCADPDLCSRMGENGRRAVAEQYDRIQLARQYLHSLRECLNEG